MGQSHKTNHTLNMQAFITLAMVAAASAAPQYAAAPVVHAVAAPDLAEPSPYTYTYAVADDYSKANFQQSESNDGTGAVTGSYSVNLPDGRIQTVTYNAEPVYPPAPAGGYVAAAPVHAVHAVAHPVVHHAPVLAHAVHAAPVHAVHHGLAHGVVAHGGLVHHG